jgi:hypothetical protein
MATARIQFSLGDRAGRPLVLSIEPWGEDYTFRSGCTVELSATPNGAEPPWFHVRAEREGVLMVFVEGAVDAFQVSEDGRPVPCGHGRE